MKKKELYDARFDQVIIENASYIQLNIQKPIDIIEANLPQNDFVCIEEIQSKFLISRYEVNQILDMIKIYPVAVKRDIVDGKKAVGLPKKVYAKDTISVIEKHLHSLFDTNKLKREAQKILENDCR